MRTYACICARFSKVDLCRPFYNFKQMKYIKGEIVEFVEWMFIPENKVFVKNSNPSVVTRLYKDQTGKSVSHGTVLYNLDKWIKINNKFYDKDRLPMDILKMNAFKKFAIENEITIEDINGSIWEEKQDLSSEKVEEIIGN